GMTSVFISKFFPCFSLDRIKIIEWIPDNYIPVSQVRPDAVEASQLSHARMYVFTGCHEENQTPSS
ncbi:hypothetical protein MHBO_005181, partial [Bonamia ostreae]